MKRNLRQLVGFVQQKQFWICISCSLGCPRCSLEVVGIHRRRPTLSYLKKYDQKHHSPIY